MEISTQRVKHPSIIAGIGSCVRRFGFQLLDNMRGGEVLRALDDLNAYQHRAYRDPALLNYVAGQLDSILRHARESVPYYSDLTSSALADFPVVDKVLIRNHMQEFASRDPRFRPKRIMKTSGSTGAPFAVAQDAAKVARTQAELLYFLGEVGFMIGDRSLILPASAPRDARSRLTQFITNQYRFASKGASSAEGKKIVDQINKQRAGVVRGVTTVFEAVESYIVEEDPESVTQLTSLVSSGSLLHSRTRERLEAFFGCRMVSRYSNQECGVLAQDTYLDDEFEINQVNYNIEVLKFESDEPAEQGEVGRVVVTDLFNRAFPLIRYDTGDLAAFDVRQIGGEQRAVLVKLAGRRYDAITDCDGKRVLPNALVNSVVHELPEVTQIQIIQEDQCDYELVLNGTSSTQQVKAALGVARQFLGERATVNVSFVSEMPVSASGKRQAVINRMIKQ